METGGIIEGNVASFKFDAFDVYNNTKYFKTHRDYVRYRFQQMGLEVVKWNWEQAENGKWFPNEDGIKFKRMESDINVIIEVSGVIGKSLRRLVVDNA